MFSGRKRSSAFIVSPRSRMVRHKASGPLGERRHGDADVADDPVLEPRCGMFFYPAPQTSFRTSFYDPWTSFYNPWRCSKAYAPNQCFKIRLLSSFPPTPPRHEILLLRRRISVAIPPPPTGRISLHRLGHEFNNPAWRKATKRGKLSARSGVPIFFPRYPLRARPTRPTGAGAAHMAPSLQLRPIRRALRRPVLGLLQPRLLRRLWLG